MSKFLYPIYKLKTKSYIKWWLYHKKAGGSGILSEILQGFSFNLENTLNRKFKLFEIEGNSVQDGSPSPDNEVPILSSGDNGTINEKISNKNLFVIKNYSKSGWIITIDNPLKGMPAGDYTISCQNKSSAGGIRTYFSNEPSGAVIGNLFTDFQFGNTLMLRKETLTQEELNAKYLILYFNSNNGSQSVLEDMQIMIEQGSTATPYVPHEEQDYSIYTQQTMRSIGDVRDCFVKKSDGKLYERHYIKYLDLAISAMNNSENYPGWTNVQQIKNDFPNINTQLITKTSFLCNIFEKTSRIMVINTVGNNSILYLDKSLLNLTQTQWKENYPNLVLKLGYISPEPLDLPCTEEQIEALENLPSTYKDFTIIQSEDETPAHLKIQYYKEG